MIWLCTVFSMTLYNYNTFHGLYELFILLQTYLLHTPVIISENEFWCFVVTAWVHDIKRKSKFIYTIKSTQSAVEEFLLVWPININIFAGINNYFWLPCSTWQGDIWHHNREAKAWDPLDTTHWLGNNIHLVYQTHNPLWPSTSSCLLLILPT